MPDPAELLRIKAERDGRRAQGSIMLPHAQPAELERACEYCKTPMQPTDERCPQCYRYPLEDAEQDDVRKLYIAYGCVVYSTSQKRRSKVSEGIPDLWVFSERAGCAGWHETKRVRGGTLSPAQLEFRDLCQLTATDWCAGGLLEARRRLVRWGLATWVDAIDGDIETTRAPAAAAAPVP